MTTITQTANAANEVHRANVILGKVVLPLICFAVDLAAGYGNIDLGLMWVLLPLLYLIRIEVTPDELRSKGEYLSSLILHLLIVSVAANTILAFVRGNTAPLPDYLIHRGAILASTLLWRRAIRKQP